MSSLDKLIRFDRQGVLGPSFSLMALAGTYNSKELVVVIKILQENAEKVAHTSLRGRKEFIQVAQAGGLSLTVTQILGTRFFQGLQAPEPLPPTYPDLKRCIAPNTLAMTSNFIPQFKEILADEAIQEALIDWLAKVLSRYMTEEQVKRECVYQQLVVQQPEIRQRRMECGRAIYAAAQNKELSKKEFDAVIWGLEHKLTSDNLLGLTEWYLGMSVRAGGELSLKKVLVHVNHYLDLFAMAGEDADQFSAHICDMLKKIFGEKFFPQEQAPLFLPTGLLGPAGLVLSLLYQANSLSEAQLTQAAKAVKRTYTVMTGHEVHGRKLFCQMFEVARQEGKQISWEEMLSSRMFTEMCSTEVDEPLYQLTKKWLVSCTYRTVRCYNQEVAAAFSAARKQFERTLIHLMASFMAQGDLIEENYWIRSNLLYGMDGRAEADTSLYKALWEGKLGEQELDLLVRSLISGEDQVQEASEDKKALFAEVLAKYRAWLGNLLSSDSVHAIRMLNIYFRETFFPESPVIS